MNQRTLIFSVLFVCRWNLTLSQTLATPSESNATHAIYRTSQTGSLSQTTIYCDADYCIIDCDTEEECDYTRMVVNNSISASIQCPLRHSCRYMDTLILNTNVTEINCDRWASCFFSEITVNGSDTFTLNCGDGTASQYLHCFYSTINIVANEVVINVLGDRAFEEVDVYAESVMTRLCPRKIAIHRTFGIFRALIWCHDAREFRDSNDLVLQACLVHVCMFSKS